MSWYRPYQLVRDQTGSDGSQLSQQAMPSYFGRIPEYVYRGLKDTAKVLNSEHGVHSVLTTDNGQGIAFDSVSSKSHYTFATILLKNR